MDLYCSQLFRVHARGKYNTKTHEVVVKLAIDLEKYVASVTKVTINDVNINQNTEYSHEYGVNCLAALRAEIVVAGRFIVKSIEQRGKFVQSSTTINLNHHRNHNNSINKSGEEAEADGIESTKAEITQKFQGMGDISSRFGPVCYTAWVSPFEFGFLTKPRQPLSIIDNVVNGFYGIAIVLTFFLAYLDRSTYLLVDNRKKIAWRYSVVLFKAMAYLTCLDSGVCTELLPCFPDWRKIGTLTTFRFDAPSLLLAGCYYYYLAAHYPNPGKTWIGYGNEDFEQESLWIRYVTSMYWLITTLTTMGYGDLHAQKDTIQAVSSFAQRNQFPARLQDQMLAHLCLKFRTDSEQLQQKESLDSLPIAIRSSISQFSFFSLLDKAYLFHGVPNDLLFQLVSEMKAEYFPPKEDVILQNEAPTDFYVLVTGTVELVVTRNGVEILLEKLKPANVGDGTVIMNSLLQDINDPLTEGVLMETENMLARGRLDLPLSLCFATLRGDDLILQKLLKRGLDANGSDNNGQTALHIAASKGNTNCVLLLLDFGADPNSRVEIKRLTLLTICEGGAEGSEVSDGDVLLVFLLESVPVMVTNVKLVIYLQKNRRVDNAPLDKRRKLETGKAGLDEGLFEEAENNFTDFSHETPPNLKTTLPDKPLSASRSRLVGSTTVKGNLESSNTSGSITRRHSSPIVDRGRIAEPPVRDCPYANGHTAESMDPRRTSHLPDSLTRKPIKSCQ
ncbi:potassium channel AKT1-like protein [Tanacetum coccineum]